jgi:hypothetical protein
MKRNKYDYRKVHLETRDQTPACWHRGDNLRLTSDIARVTCRACVSAIKWQDFIKTWDRKCTQNR